MTYKWLLRQMLLGLLVASVALACTTPIAGAAKSGWSLIVTPGPVDPGSTIGITYNIGADAVNNNCFITITVSKNGIPVATLVNGMSVYDDYSTSYVPSSGGVYTVSATAIAMELRGMPHYYTIDSRSAQFAVRGPPTTTAAVTSGIAGSDGWYRSDVGVTLTAANDGVGISEIHYQVNDGTDQVAAGATAVVPVTAEGADNVITFYAINVYGNRESVDKTFTVKIDKTAPVISVNPDRDPNSGGWYNADMTTMFTASDALSGIASVTGPVTLGEGADQTVTGTATDVAGNVASCTAKVNIDKTSPTVTASLNGHQSTKGWYDGDVTLTVLASDSLSGIGVTAYSLDGSSWTPYYGPVTVPPGLARPLYYGTVDRAGNGCNGSVFVYFPPNEFASPYDWQAVREIEPAPGTPTPAAAPTPVPAGSGTPVPTTAPSPTAVTEQTAPGYSLSIVIVAVVASSLLSGFFGSMFMYYLFLRQK